MASAGEEMIEALKQKKGQDRRASGFKFFVESYRVVESTLSVQQFRGASAGAAEMFFGST